MSDLTVSERMNYAAARAREVAAEKHFFDAHQPHHPLGFSVVYRNPGHWDVIARDCPGKDAAWASARGQELAQPDTGGRARAFRIRGEPGEVVVMDERWNPHRPHPRESLTFRSIQAAMLWISEELMQEPAPPAPADRSEGGR